MQGVALGAAACLVGVKSLSVCVCACVSSCSRSLTRRANHVRGVVDGLRICYAWPKEQKVSESVQCRTGTANPPCTTWREGREESSWTRCALPRLCYPPHPPPLAHPRSTSPSPIPAISRLTFLLLSEQFQPAIACAILCLVPKNRQHITAYKYLASPYLAVSFPGFHPSHVSVSAPGILWPPHGPNCRALGLRPRD